MVSLAGFRRSGLRLTTIKVWTGEVELIPNSLIGQITNYSKNNSVAVIDVNISYQADIQQAMRIVEQILSKMKAEFDVIVGDVSVLGVKALNDSSITLSAIAECAPYQQGGIVREAMLRIHDAFAEAGIMPFKQAVSIPDSGKPADQPKEA